MVKHKYMDAIICQAWFYY